MGSSSGGSGGSGGSSSSSRSSSGNSRQIGTCGALELELGPVPTCVACMQIDRGAAYT